MIKITAINGTAIEKIFFTADFFTFYTPPSQIGDFFKSVTILNHIYFTSLYPIFQVVLSNIETPVRFRTPGTGLVVRFFQNVT